MENSVKTKKKTTRKRKPDNKTPRLCYWASLDKDGMPLGRLSSLALDLVDGVKKGKYNCIEHFLAEQLLPYHTWEEWTKKHPVVGEANEVAKHYLYVERIEMGKRKECSEKLLIDMWRYSLMHRKDIVWEKNLTNEKIRSLEAQLKEQISTNNTNIIIQLDGEQIVIPNPNADNTCKEK